MLYCPSKGEVVMTESAGLSSSQPQPAGGGLAGKEPRDLEKNAMSGKPNRLLYVLLAGLILLAVAGLALLGAYFWISRQQAAPAAPQNLLEAVKVANVAPDLAVLSLAGESDERVIKAALDAGEMETAYAGLAYSVLLPDATRSGQWLLLAGRYAGGADAAAKPVDPARTQLAYQTALDQAALSPGLGDVTRAGMSLQVARGLASISKAPGTAALARLALKQAENVARYSLTLLPAQRRDTFEQVIAGYRRSGDQQAATNLQNQIGPASAGPGVKLPPAADLLAGLRGSIVLPADVTEALVARQQAAASVAATWLQSDANARRELTSTLGTALVAEDTARSAFYDTLGDLSQADQLAMLHDRINWLTIKYRVARRAYGTSLVPEWEGQVADIATTLAAAYTDLINGYGRQLDTLEAGDAAVGRLQLLQEGLLWSRLGLFPDHAEDALRTQLIEAAHQLWIRRGSAGLVIVVQDVGNQHFYLLSGADPAKNADPSATK
jgi:hypothetical protein